MPLSASRLAPHASLRSPRTPTIAGDARLFEQVAAHVSDLIERGALRVGDRLPSVRRMSRERRVSVATILAAYEKLENEGLVEARPKSGHFVRRRAAAPEPPRHARLALAATKVSVSSGVAALVEAMRHPQVVPLGAAMVAPELLPIRSLNRILASIAREVSTAGALYEPPPGLLSLRRQLAKRSVTWGLSLTEDDLLVTSGAMEALHLALRATTKAGDAIAIASPTYFGLLQLAEEMGLRAIEIPTLPSVGLDLDALERALGHTPVKAVLAVTTFDNPMGALMSLADKQRLVRMVERHGIPLIEDDIYGDLGFDGSRPPPAKAFDKTGSVIYASSISKTIAAGYRIGWVAGGRYQETLERLKFSQSVAAPTLLQMAVAEYLSSGSYDRHLRHLREALAQQVAQYRAEIGLSFPPGTRVSEPRGGFVLWVDLPGGQSALELQRRALARGIAIAPGPIFSARQRFGSSIRISCGAPMSPRMSEAVHTLGELVWSATKTWSGTSHTSN